MNELIAGIRLLDLRFELLAEGYSHAAIDAAQPKVIVVDGERIFPDGESLPDASGLDLPQEGDGWLLSPREAARFRSLVEQAEPRCGECGRPNPTS